MLQHLAQPEMTYACYLNFDWLSSAPKLLGVFKLNPSIGSATLGPRLGILGTLVHEFQELSVFGNWSLIVVAYPHPPMRPAGGGVPKFVPSTKWKR